MILTGNDIGTKSLSNFTEKNLHSFFYKCFVKFSVSKNIARI